MPVPQLECAPRSFPARWWPQLLLLLRYLRLAVGVGSVFWVNPADCLAAEKLWLNAARASITSSELHSHVSLLADDMLEGREAGSRGGRVAAKYLIGRLKAAELMPAGTHGHYKQSFLHNHQNLLAILPGTDPELRHETLVVGAHYDHVGYGSRRNSYGPWGFIHNGADDNASGVAAVLEVIDALSHTDHRPRRSILFAFWDGEEKGLLGSKHWKNNPTVPFENVKLAINVDMVGRLTAGRIEVGGTRTALGSRRLLSSSRLSDGLWLDFNWEFKDNSDHWTFFEAGVPSLYLHTGLHDDYHRPSDDVEKLNIDGIRAVSGYLLEQVSHLADAEVLPSFRPVARQETPAVQQRLEMPLPALPPRLAFTWEYKPGNPASVVVKQVPTSSPANHAGLLPGDRIVQVNGKPIAGADYLSAIALQSDVPLELQVQRPGVAAQFPLTLPLNGNPTRLGLSWRADEAEPGAVTITRVVPHSPADLAGIVVHDRLYQINGQTISGQEELLNEVRQLLEEMADGGKTIIQFQVESRGNIREVSVSLGPPTAPTADATL